MLKLKSIVKTREQLLATGWYKGIMDEYHNKEVDNGSTIVNPRMIGRVYDGIIKGRTERCKLDGVDETWIIYPEMVLLIDQWGFVRDTKTFDILMWDAARYNKAACVNGISKDEDSSICVSVPYSHSVSYTKDGYFYKGVPPTLSKYPYSLQYGGYTPFNFDELKQAFNCKKTTDPATPSDSGNSTKPDSCRSTVAPNGYSDTEVNAEAQVKDESGSATLDDLFGEKETQIWSEISTRERVVSLLERLENLRSSNLPGVKEKVEAVMLDMVKKLVV